MEHRTESRFLPELSRPLLAGLLLAASLPLHATLPGDRDPSFELPMALPIATRIPAALKTPSGHILAVWHSGAKQQLIRLQSNGQLDPDFQVTELTRFIPGRLAVQSDGRILCATWPDLARPSVSRIVRFESNGAPDAGFLFEQSVGSMDSITPLSDGSLLLGSKFGPSDDFSPGLFLHRLSPSGAIDPSFALSGTFNTIGNIRHVRATSGDAFLIAGNFLGRISSTGVRDDTYLGNSLTGRTEAVAPLPDGRLVLAGRFLDSQGIERPQVLRLRADGSVDPEFIPTEYEGEVDRLAVSPGGRVILAGPIAKVGGLRRIGVARLLPNGGVDSSFVCDVLPAGPMPGAVTDIDIQGLEFLDETRLLIAGQFSRIHGVPIGQPLVVVHADESLSGPPQWIGLPEQVTVVEGHTLEIRARAQSAIPGTIEWRKLGTPVPGATNADLVIRNVRPSHAGEYTVNVVTALGSATGKVLVQVQPAPWNPGAVDPGFDVGQGAGTWFKPPGIASDRLLVATGSDGRVYLAGNFQTFDGKPHAHLVALKADGTIDRDFRWNPVHPGAVLRQITAIATTPSGDLYVAAALSPSLVGPITQSVLWKIGADGTRDASFDQLGGVRTASKIIGIQFDSKGRILVTRERTGPVISRLLSDGSVDPAFRRSSFQVSQTLEKVVNAVLPLGGGTFLVGGSFRMAGEAIVNGLVQFEDDGMLDHGFGAGLGPNDVVEKLWLAPDGGILVGLRAAPFLLKFNHQGAPFPGFEAPKDLGGVDDLAVDSEWRILIATGGTQSNGEPRHSLVRLLHDGTRDTGFDFAPVLQAPLAIALQEDDQVLVAGSFQEPSATERSTLLRIQAGDDQRLVLQRAPDGNARVKWSSRLARLYRIEEATSLELQNWKVVHTTEGTGGTLEWNTGSTPAPRFFRMRLD